MTLRVQDPAQADVRLHCGVTGSGPFRHSPRVARSCRSSCGRPGRPERPGPAGTPAGASVSGRGCSELVGYCGRREDDG